MARMDLLPTCAWRGPAATIRPERSALFDSVSVGPERSFGGDCHPYLRTRLGTRRSSTLFCKRSFAKRRDGKLRRSVKPANRGNVSIAPGHFGKGQFSHSRYSARIRSGIELGRVCEVCDRAAQRQTSPPILQADKQMILSSAGSSNGNRNVLTVGSVRSSSC